MLPTNVRFTPTHEWCKLQDGVVVIGLTPQGVAPLGDIVFVELPEVGDDVLHEVPFGEIEGARNVRDVSSPIDGMVVAVNPKLSQTPEALSKDPFGDGWLLRIRPEGAPKLENTLSAADYDALLKKSRPR
jgi:glycine cleavage system H protein